MRNHNVFIFFSILFSFSAICLTSAHQEQLIKKDYFPKDKVDRTYTALTDIEISPTHIYIVENIPGHNVQVYKKTGELLCTIGKRGKKPGELSVPIEFSVWKNEIAINDMQGLSFFTTDGRFVRRIRPFVHVVSFVYIKDKIYILVGTPENRSLIHVFSREGRYLSEFGKEFVTLDYSLFKNVSPFHVKGWVYQGKLLSDGESLYYLNSAFGKAMIFSLEGKKLLDVEIAKIFGDEGDKVIGNNTSLWLKEGIDLEKTKGAVPVNQLFEDAYLSGDKIYVLTRKWLPAQGTSKPGREGFAIKVLDKGSFRVEADYVINKNDDEGVTAIAVENTAKGPSFYFTMWRRNRASVIAKFGREK